MIWAIYFIFSLIQSIILYDGQLMSEFGWPPTPKVADVINERPLTGLVVLVWRTMDSLNISFEFLGV